MLSFLEFFSIETLSKKNTYNIPLLTYLVTWISHLSLTLLSNCRFKVYRNIFLPCSISVIWRHSYRSLCEFGVILSNNCRFNHRNGFYKNRWQLELFNMTRKKFCKKLISYTMPCFRCMTSHDTLIQWNISITDTIGSWKWFPI